LERILAKLGIDLILRMKSGRENREMRS
jgi:hypothetical protein